MYLTFLRLHTCKHWWFQKAFEPTNMYVSEVVATNNEDQRRIAYLCNFIFHDGIPILQKGFCTHPLVNPDSYRVVNRFFSVCHHLRSTTPFYEWNVQFFSFGILKWEFEAGKDECHVFSCSGIGSFVNNPETHGKWKREVNKSVEAKRCNFHLPVCQKPLLKWNYSLDLRDSQSPSRHVSPPPPLFSSFNLFVHLSTILNRAWPSVGLGCLQDSGK